MIDRPATLASNDTYRCSLTRPARQPIELVIERGREGTVRGDGLRLEIAPVSEQVNQPFPMPGQVVGVILIEEGREVAAVDLSPASSVTLRRDMPEARRNELAAISMALLLYRDMN